MDCNDADEVFLNGLGSENPVISLFCFGAPRTGVGGFCSTNCSETQLREIAVEMTLGLCGQIPANFSTITFLGVAICIHSSRPPSFRVFYLYLLHDSWLQIFFYFIFYMGKQYTI
jgi:hypothetical protein